MVRKPSRVIVVGAGIGGLACAIDLASTGLEVLVLERARVPGGKMRTFDVGGCAIDAGPTVLTMRWVFDELFAAAGTTLAEHVDLERCELLARHAWPDGTRLDLHSDREKTAAEIRNVFGEREARAYVDYTEDGRRIFESVEGPFLRAQRPTVASIVRRTGIGGLGAFARIDAFHTMWSALVRRFETPHLRQLFGRYATYCGSSPFEAPGTLSLVSYVEGAGVHRVRGGMAGLATALAKLAESRGVEIRYGYEVERILVGASGARGVVANGEEHAADAVVFNGDVSALGTALLGEAAAKAAKPTARRDRSLSAVTWAVVGRSSGLPLVHHNVFFSEHYTDEFDALLARDGRERTPDHPTVYLCAQDRGDVGVDLAPGAHERMLLVVNAPATGDEPSRWSETELLRCEETTFKAMERCGLSLEARASRMTTPVDFARDYPGSGGALYGPIARGAFSGLSRHAARSKIPRLYLAGGSVHPGPGVPMVALSGRLAAAQLRSDLGSTGRSLLADTAGTTSMA